jgi:hypothetical protein
VVFTRYDTMWGFAEVFMWTPERKGEEAWGFVLPGDTPSQQAVQRLNTELDGLAARFEAFCLAKLSSEDPPEHRTRAFQHLVEVKLLMTKLRALLGVIAMANAFERAPWSARSSSAAPSGHRRPPPRRRGPLLQHGPAARRRASARGAAGRPAPPQHMKSVVLPEKDLVPTRTRWRDDKLIVIRLHRRRPAVGRLRRGDDRRLALNRRKTRLPRRVFATPVGRQDAKNAKTAAKDFDGVVSSPRPGDKVITKAWRPGFSVLATWRSVAEFDRRSTFTSAPPAQARARSSRRAPCRWEERAVEPAAVDDDEGRPGEPRHVGVCPVALDERRRAGRLRIALPALHVEPELAGVLWRSDSERAFWCSKTPLHLPVLALVLRGGGGPRCAPRRSCAS